MRRATVICVILAVCCAEVRAVSQIEVQFEDIAGGTTFLNASLPTSFVTEGVEVLLSALTSGSNAMIGTSNQAGSTGNELLLYANARADLDIGLGSNGGFFYFRDSGGENFLEINGSTVDFDVISAGPAGTVGGVSYSSSPLSGGARSVKLGGNIHTFALIGQELAVDRIALDLVPEPASVTLGSVAVLLGLALLRRGR